MSPIFPVWVCFAAAAGIVFLEWLLSGLAAAPRAPSPTAGQDLGSTEAVRSAAAATVTPSATSPARPTEEIESLAPALRQAMAPLGVSAAALWVDRRASAPRADSAPRPPAIEVEFAQPGRLQAADLPHLFRPWHQALLAGEIVCIPDAASEPDLCGSIRLAAANLVLVPFSPSDADLGVLALAWNRPASVGAEEVQSARLLAGQLRERLEPGDQRREIHTLQAQEQVLLRVAGALRYVDDLPLALRTILEATREGLGYRNCAILLADAENGQLFVASQVGYGGRVDGLRLDLSGPSVTATAARERRAVSVPDVSAWPGYVPGDEQIRSEIALPLLVEGELQGVLDIESATPDAFEGAAREILDAVASEAALILAHVHSLRRVQERADQLQAADHLARAITASIDPQTILDRTVQEVRGCIDADAVVILLRGETEAELWTVNAIACQGETLGPPPLAGDSEALLEASHRPEGGAFDDCEQEAGPFAAWCLAAGWRSVFWVPVVLEGRGVGLFVTGRKLAHSLTPGRKAILQALVSHILAAVRNALLYHQLENSFRQLSEASAQNSRHEQLRVLGEITSGLAHKFNNLLGVILARAQTAMARAEGTDLERDLRIVEQAAYEGSITIRQLQQFTGTRADRALRPIPWGELITRGVERGVRNWRPEGQAGSEVYRVRCEVAEDAWILGVAEECEEIVEHLIHNAVDAMPDGGMLSIRLAPAQAAWVFEVSDTGPGIDEETRARLFHPFFTTKGPRNLGLGLSIAYALVTRLGGEIEVDSTPEVGARLRVTLPAAESQGERECSPLALPRPARILIVDDEPAVSEVLSEILQAAGHDCATEPSAGVAVARLATESFDLVLSDLGMPGMTGWDLAYHCRDLHAEIPVILVTGWGLELDDDRVAEAGVFEVLAKPFEVQTVLDAVSRGLQRTQSQAA